MDGNCISVVEGGIPETTELLKQRFDHIFFTGGAHVGRIVASAASAHLTTCTLELGGKCPVYIDDNVNLNLAAKRLAWGKYVNLGQTCVAPDYVICSKDTEVKLLAALAKLPNQFYGPKPETSPHLGRQVFMQSRLLHLCKRCS